MTCNDLSAALLATAPCQYCQFNSCMLNGVALNWTGNCANTQAVASSTESAAMAALSAAIAFSSREGSA